MAEEKDALSTFDFSKVTKPSVFLRFEPGEPVKLRILTTDPVVSTTTFEDKKTGDEILNTRFAFIVYNYNAQKAQVMQVTPNTAKKISELHVDEDYGANIKKIDLKIIPPEKNEIKAYDIQVLPNAQTLTNEQIKECQAINLDELVKGDRASFYKAPEPQLPTTQLNDEKLSTAEEDSIDIEGEPINIDDIPF